MKVFWLAATAIGSVLLLTVVGTRLTLGGHDRPDAGIVQNRTENRLVPDSSPPVEKADARPAKQGALVPPSLKLTLTTTPLGTAKPDATTPYTFSRDGLHVMFGTQQKPTPDAPDRWAVAVDGQMGKHTYDQLGALLLSPDGRHFAFSGKRGQRAVVVLDGVEGPAYDEIDSLHFSADGSRVGYIARPYQGGIAVVDGVAGTPYIGGVSNLVFSRDGKHAAYIAGHGTRLNNHIDDVVVVDGVEGTPMFSMLSGSLRYSPDGKHLVVAAKPSRTALRYFIYLDGRPSQRSYDILPQGSDDGCVMRFSPDSRHLACVAQREDHVVLVLDGRESPYYIGIMADTVQFSPDSAHWGYVAYVSRQLGGNSAVVVDGREGAPCDAVTSLQLAAGGRFAYVAQRGGKQVCVTEAGPGKAYTQVGTPAFSSDGQHLAFIARREDFSAVVVLDGAEQQPYQDVSENLCFSPDGKHLAYFAAAPGGPSQGGQRKVLVRDGVEVKTFSWLDSLDPQTMTFSPDGRHLAYAVAGFKANAFQSVVVVDGVESPSVESIPTGARPVFAGPDKLHLLALREGMVVRVDLGIQGVP